MSHCLTLLCHPERPKIKDDHLGALADCLDRAVDITWLDPMIACDIPVSQGEIAAVNGLAEDFDLDGIDMAIQLTEGRRKSVLIADMDSTMIEQECIDELADKIGIKEKVSKITERAMRGEIDFEPALRERVALLQGLSLCVIDDVMRDKITFRSGGRALVQTMKANGAYTALVSGGFTMFTERVAAHLGFDENRANILIEKAGRLTGEVAEPILGASAKVSALEDIAAKRDKMPADFLAIGDGANDVPMIERAGLGVAIHAKPKVAAQADLSIKHGDLTALLYVQGYRRADFVE